MMRNMTLAELKSASGGGDIADAAAVGASLGGALGLAYAMSQGATGTAATGAAALGAAGFAGVATAGAIGWAAGNLLNEYTPIQSWISSGIDSLQSGWGAISDWGNGAT